MKKTILITGATDGIGYETANMLAAQGHILLLHGRSEAKLQQIKNTLAKTYPKTQVDMFLADLSNLNEVVRLADDVKAKYDSLDALINNAGVFKIPNAVTFDGYDIRFIVNTLAPYILTKALLPLMDENSRVVNLSSAAQAPVDLSALKGVHSLSDSAAYAQSKLAITMWSFHLAQSLGKSAPAIIAVNPASFLGSKMVKEAYGSQGKDLSIGANILVRAVLSDDFSHVTGRYFDNDIGKFADPHPDALNADKNETLVVSMNALINEMGIQL